MKSNVIYLLIIGLVLMVYMTDNAIETTGQPVYTNPELAPSSRVCENPKIVKNDYTALPEVDIDGRYFIWGEYDLSTPYPHDSYLYAYDMGKDGKFGTADDGGKWMITSLDKKTSGSFQRFGISGTKVAWIWDYGYIFMCDMNLNGMNGGCLTADQKTQVTNAATAPECNYIAGYCPNLVDLTDNYVIYTTPYDQFYNKFFVYYCEFSKNGNFGGCNANDLKIKINIGPTVTSFYTSNRMILFKQNKNYLLYDINLMNLYNYSQLDKSAAIPLTILDLNGIDFIYYSKIGSFNIYYTGPGKDLIPGTLDDIPETKVSNGYYDTTPIASPRHPKFRSVVWTSVEPYIPGQSYPVDVYLRALSNNGKINDVYKLNNAAVPGDVDISGNNVVIGDVGSTRVMHCDFWPEKNSGEADKH